MENPPSKILLAFLFWERDKAQMCQLARLIADLEPGMCESADVLFSARFDCTHDLETIQYVSRKFKVHTNICRGRRGVGWPAGCNDIVFGTLDYVHDYGAAKRIPPYKAVALLEADGAPLRKGWIEELSRAWDEANAKKPVRVFGPLLDTGVKDAGFKHINGNCLVSGDKVFLHWFTRKLGGCTPRAGWDWCLAPQFKRLGWADCKQMKSWWRCPGVSEEQYNQLLDAGVCYLHGCKNEDVWNLVRKKYL
jgi:hypothetical protein